MKNTLPIGIFDSGIGGLTVYKKLREMLPNEHMVYFGDTGRAPYGNRPEREIAAFVDEIMRFMAVCGVKAGVIACNTITVLGAERLAERYNFDLIGNSKGIRSALAATKNKRIGVIATAATIRSGKHRQELLRADPSLTVFGQACPRFAPLIETGDLDSPALRAAAIEYLTPLKERAVDVVILGCTHYPFIAPLIQEVMGEGTAVIDPALETAQDTWRYLKARDGLNPAQTPGRHALYFSARPEQAQKIAASILDVRACAFRSLDLRPLAAYENLY